MDSPTPRFVSRLLAGAGTVLCAVLTAASSPGQSLDAVGQIAATLEPTRKIVYKTVVDRELHLHVFEPDGFAPDDRRPCFLIIHGGGWRGMSPRRMYPFAAHFAKLGMVGIAPEYRLVRPDSGTNVFHCVQDARSAVRYVRRHAAKLGIDPGRIVVSGASAGGHLAAGTALFDGVEEPGEDTSVSCMPDALVLLFPVIDTSAEGYGNALLGDRWRELSPLHQVRPGMPPTIVFHGSADTTTPFAGAKAFHRAMLEAGNRCELIVTEGGRHGYMMTSRPVFEASLKRIEEYLAELDLLKVRPTQKTGG
ncbi:MAG: alpha/beta hydrolase [Thermoguttaceae bacterium]|nr:alpha/beta hydrolase [Thermoguttaceae bacterium]